MAKFQYYIVSFFAAICLVEPKNYLCQAHVKYIDNVPALKARGSGVQAWNPFSWLTGALEMEYSPKRTEKLQDYLDLIGYDKATYSENFAINAVPSHLLDEETAML